MRSCAFLPAGGYFLCRGTVTYSGCAGPPLSRTGTLQLCGWVHVGLVSGDICGVESGFWWRGPHSAAQAPYSGVGHVCLMCERVNGCGAPSLNRAARGPRSGAWAPCGGL